MTIDRSGAGQAGGPPLARRQIAAIVSGNGLEYYDFVVYAIFAGQIGRTFFPSDKPGVSLLASLATFGVGFVTRPFGALLLGRVGDLRGRKPAMLLSFMLIGLSVAGLALTPGYATIGRWAPVLAIFFRLLQGFAIGGEVGPSTALLMESAPRRHRGLYVSLQSMSADAAVLVAGGVGVALSSLLAPAALNDWGWRLALLLGLLILPYSLAIRHTLLETIALEEAIAPAPAPGRPSRILVLGLCMLTGSTVCNYVLVYLGTYAATTLGIVQRSAFVSTMLVGLGGVICDPLSGWLSDRFGRRPVMIAPAATLVVLVFPFFWWIVHHPTPIWLAAVSTLLACMLDLSTGTIRVAVLEALPRRRRASGFGLTYALAISVFGGSTQFIVAWLIRTTGEPLIPAFIMIAALGVGLAAMIGMPETAPGRPPPERRLPLSSAN